MHGWVLGGKRSLHGGDACFLYVSSVEKRWELSNGTERVLFAMIPLSFSAGVRLVDG